MRGPFVPIKSGIHRAACLALFRVLLRRSRNVLPPEALIDFRKHVVGAFRKDAKTQDQAAIRAALTSGYEVVNNLTTRKLHVLRQLAESIRPDKAIQDQFARRRASDGAKAKEQVSNRPMPRIFDTGRRSPRPAARPVLHGLPSPLPGHHRRVPTIINANHIPFLRFKKPQSPFLSHMIRKKTDEREKRIVRTQRLEKLLPLAEDEDRWDDTVSNINGISSNDGGTTWAWATREALTHVKKIHKDNTIKRMHTAQRMFDIVEEQRKLADQEKRVRRDQRHQAYKARRRLKGASLAAEQRPEVDDDTPIASAAGI